MAKNRWGCRNCGWAGDDADEAKTETGMACPECAHVARESGSKMSDQLDTATLRSRVFTPSRVSKSGLAIMLLSMVPGWLLGLLPVFWFRGESIWYLVNEVLLVTVLMGPVMVAEDYWPIFAGGAALRVVGLGMEHEVIPRNG